jgi:hypothetical protein
MSTLRVSIGPSWPVSGSIPKFVELPVIGWSSVIAPVMPNGRSHASPSGKFEKAVRQSANDPEAGPTAPQSIAAQLEHQPTPGSVKRAEEGAEAAFEAGLMHAERLDARGDRAGCRRALADAKLRFEFQ